MDEVWTHWLDVRFGIGDRGHYHRQLTYMPDMLHRVHFTVHKASDCCFLGMHRFETEKFVREKTVNHERFLLCDWIWTEFARMCHDYCACWEISRTDMIAVPLVDRWPVVYSFSSIHRMVEASLLTSNVLSNVTVQFALSTFPIPIIDVECYDRCCMITYGRISDLVTSATDRTWQQPNRSSISLYVCRNWPARRDGQSRLRNDNAKRCAQSSVLSIGMQFLWIAKLLLRICQYVW
jgi:hypothetical protein